MKQEPRKQSKSKADTGPAREPGKKPVIRTGLRKDGHGPKAAEGRADLEIDLLTQIKDVVICLDPDETIFCWNHAAEKLYGVKDEQAMGRNYREFFRTEWIEPIDESDALQSLEKSGYWQGDNIQILKNGDSIFVESSLSVLKGKRHRVVGVLVVSRDITARKQAELARVKLHQQIVKQQQRIEESLWTIEKERKR